MKVVAERGSREWWYEGGGRERRQGEVAESRSVKAVAGRCSMRVVAGRSAERGGKKEWHESGNREGCKVA